jgi:2-keto-3-deoxy-L-rhamnonate aldolase RhmA
VAANDPTLIKLALDTGAHHIVVPMVNTKEEVEAGVAAAKYPPQGIRGYGPFRIRYQWNTNMLDYGSRANAETKVSVLIEHPRAIEDLDEILNVESLGGAVAYTDCS